jgi:hypothetical protein
VIHNTTPRFWQCLAGLPTHVQSQARIRFELLQANPAHPSIQLKPVKNGAYFSARVSLGYRALGIPVPTGIVWFWIGSHADYDKLLV